MLNNNIILENFDIYFSVSEIDSFLSSSLQILVTADDRSLNILNTEAKFWPI